MEVAASSSLYIPVLVLGENEMALAVKTLQRNFHILIFLYLIRLTSGNIPGKDTYHKQFY